jgi:hypothetical protein
MDTDEHGFSPQGFGVRQPSGAFDGKAGDAKAAEVCRNPRRWRAGWRFYPCLSVSIRG